MPDNTLQFETRVNLGGLESGMAQASSVVQSGSDKMSTALKNQANAAAQLSEAYRAFGSAASQGSQQAADALGEYVAAAKSADAAVQALNSTEQQETATVRSSISARMAASSELRVMEGNMMGSTRAAAALLSTLPGVGAAMQAAFPIFGAVALVEILGQVAEKVHAVYDEWANLRTLQNEVNKQVIADEGEEIALSNQRLSQLREQRVLTAELAGSKAGRSDRGAAAGANFDIHIDQNDLVLAQGNLQRVTQRIQELQQASKTYQTVSNGRLITVQTDDMRRAAALLPQLREDAAKYSQEIDTLNQKLEVSGQKETLRSREASEKGDNSAARAQLEEIQNQFARLNAEKSALVGHPLTAGEAASFWDQYIDTFKAKSTEATRVLSEFSKYQSENHKQIESAYKTSQQSVSSDAAERGMAEFGKEIQKQGEDITRTGERWKEYNAEVVKEGEIHTQVASAIELADIAQGASVGSITKAGAAHQLAAVHAKAYADRLAELKAQLDAINADPALTAVQKATQSQGVQNQIQQTQGQAKVSAITDTTTQAQALSTPYTTAFTNINNGFLAVQQKMILGTRSISRDFAEMGANLVVSTASAFEKMLANAALSEIKLLTLHEVTNTAKITSDTSAAAATQAITTQSTFMQVEKEAAVVAAKTWSALAGIPVIGPVLGAAAAGTAYAGVMALAAFETGGIIPNTGVAMVHQGEAVLPRNLTNMLMNTANTSNSANSNMTVNNFGNSDKSFRSSMNRNAEQMVRTVHRGARRLGRT